MEFIEVNPIQPLPKDWKHKSYLLLIRPGHIPPHLAIMYKGAYFSLSIRGNAIGEDGIVWFQKFERKKIPILWVEFKNVSFEHVTIEFSKFKNRELGEITCLAPIKNVFLSNANLIYEILEDQQFLEKVKGYFTTNIIQSKIKIAKYTLEDIYNHIQNLKNNA